MSIEKRLLSITELADYLGVKVGTLYNIRSAGRAFPVQPIEIPSRGSKRPTIRFDKQAVDAWITEEAKKGQRETEEHRRSSSTTKRK